MTALTPLRSPQCFHRDTFAASGQFGDDMALKLDDWVQTEKGAPGRVVGVDGSTVSVAISSPPEPAEALLEFQEYRLKKSTGRISCWAAYGTAIDNFRGTINLALCLTAPSVTRPASPRSRI
jgi:hypothetical protein